MFPFEESSTVGTGALQVPEVVEIGLLLPTAWARSLLEISQRKGISVGQLLRGVIGHALAEGRRGEDDATRADLHDTFV